MWTATRYKTNLAVDESVCFEWTELTCWKFFAPPSRAVENILPTHAPVRCSPIQGIRSHKWYNVEKYQFLTSYIMWRLLLLGGSSLFSPFSFFFFKWFLQMQNNRSGYSTMQNFSRNFQPKHHFFHFSPKGTVQYYSVGGGWWWLAHWSLPNITTISLSADNSSSILEF